MAKAPPEEKPKSAASFVPPKPTLRTARLAAAGCRGCDLWRKATQTVFGEGSSRAAVVFVGEQPGDAEDLAGKPFVGPAGRVLDRALEAVGIACLRHQRRQTLQMGAARKATHPCQASPVRNSCLPAVARNRACADQTACARVPRRDGRASAARTVVQGNGSEGHVRAVTARAARHGDGASVFHLARADGRRAPPGDGGVHRRSQNARQRTVILRCDGRRHDGAMVMFRWSGPAQDSRTVALSDRTVAPSDRTVALSDRTVAPSNRRTVAPRGFVNSSAARNRRPVLVFV